MSGPKFHVDSLSSDRASEVVSALEHQQDFVIEHELPRAFRTFGYRSALKDAMSEFSSPLRRRMPDIPVRDVADDLEDFGTLAGIADVTGSLLPAIRIGSKTIPVLPPKDHLATLPASRLFSDQGESILQEIATATLKRDALVMQPATTLRQIFFDQLKRFLAFRIAGAQWAQDNITDSALSFRGEPATAAAGAGGGGGWGSSGGSTPRKPSSQEWTVHTSGTGFSIYYGGTHAIRSRPTYLNGPTTPVQVFLPMGTIILASDGGPGGDYIWDGSEVDVPSENPVYYTRAF